MSAPPLENVLAALREGPWSLAELVELVGGPRTNVYRTLVQLEREGHARRGPDPRGESRGDFWSLDPDWNATRNAPWNGLGMLEPDPPPGMPEVPKRQSETCIPRRSAGMPVLARAVSSYSRTEEAQEELQQQPLSREMVSPGERARASRDDVRALTEALRENTTELRALRAALAGRAAFEDRDAKPASEPAGDVEKDLQVALELELLEAEESSKKKGEPPPGEGLRVLKERELRADPERRRRAVARSVARKSWVDNKPDREVLIGYGQGGHPCYELESVAKAKGFPILGVRERVGAAS